jgi:predicted outer membrane lipoprotein
MTLAASCARMVFRRRASSYKAARRLFIVAAGLLLTCAFVVVTAICYAEIEGLIVVT